MSAPLVSVVIPAHGEQLVLGRCLSALADDEFDVIVVANACTDDTAGVARAAGVRVVETAVAGKANALNLGDAECRGFPRLYLDADIELTAAGVRDLVKALTMDGVLAVAPAPRTDLSGSSWAVRRFHVVLQRLMGERAGFSGAGAYLLSEAAHDRVFPMPRGLIADDALVHRSFDVTERAVVDAVSVTVRAPRTVPALIRRRARVRLGNRQLAGLGTGAAEPPLRLGRLRALVRQGEIGRVDACCFLVILLADRALARWRDRRGTQATWSRDDTTRS